MDEQKYLNTKVIEYSTPEQKDRVREILGGLEFEYLDFSLLTRDPSEYDGRLRELKEGQMPYYEIRGLLFCLYKLEPERLGELESRIEELQEPEVVLREPYDRKAF